MRRLSDATGVEIYQGESGRTYEFLAIATDIAGNREFPGFGVTAPDDGQPVNLGAIPTVPETTPPNFGIPPEPTPEPSTNPLFNEAELGIPNVSPLSRFPEFESRIAHWPA